MTFEESNNIQLIMPYVLYVRSSFLWTKKTYVSEYLNRMFDVYTVYYTEPNLKYIL